MSLSEKQMKHPCFDDMARAVNAAIAGLADSFDISSADLETQRTTLDRAADDLVRALMKAWDKQHS